MPDRPKRPSRNRQPKREAVDEVGRSAPAGRRETAPRPGKSLDAYAQKRDFATTPEPRASAKKPAGDRFCVQKHAARRLHFDLRLELDGVLKSWAVTRGPSLVPGEKRLAVHTEDHPLEYLTFEGVIPKGEYGGGTMIVWDQGRWTPLADPKKGYAKGHLDFELAGQRLKGHWHLVRMRPRPREKKEQWLLLKGDDGFARTPGDPEITEEENASVISGRTNADLAALGEVRRDHAARADTKAKPAPVLPRPRGARKGLLPVFLEPSLASISDKAPSSDAWIHEIKLDGYRLQARVDGHSIKLLTRKGLDWTDKFNSIAAAVRNMGLGSALLDGEVVVEDEAGVSSFTSLQADLEARRTERMVFFAFDLLYLDGYDLTKVPLLERKTLLAGLLDDAPADAVVRFSAHLESNGEAIFRHACRLGLEGIVSKRKDRPYIGGRGTHWLKTKCTHREEFVIAGYVPSTTSGKAVGSLVMGIYEGGDLIHVGRVGSGFTAGSAQSLWRELEAFRRPASPFALQLPRVATRGVRWVEPKLVAEVEFRGWTGDGLLRHSSFKGLRDDKEATEVERESKGRNGEDASKDLADFHLTHPDRVLWPDVGLTKQGLAEFYADVADWILPHVIGRPLALVRCPSGVENECFFQKHSWNGIGKAIRAKSFAGEEVLYIEDLDGLIALVQSSVLEIHPWGSTVTALEKPDRMTMDLDPAEDVPWTALIDGALELRERLRGMGLESFVKTTGGKGLHVVVPLARKAGWDDVKAFAQGLAEAMAGDSPQRFVATMSKRVRKGRIFIDYLRNGRGATAVAAYSTRARPGAAVSTPLAWEELSPSLRPNHYTVENLSTRLRHLRSKPWPDLDDVRQTLPVRRIPPKSKR